MQDFVESVGRPLFAHRLRRLSEALVEGCRVWMEEAGITAPPKALSTLMMLSAGEPLAVTEIASRLQFSHPFLVQLTRDLERLGFVRIKQDPNDGRRRLVSLTAAGRAEAQRLDQVNAALDDVYRRLFKEAGMDGFLAVEKIEQTLAKQSFADRLRAVKPPRADKQR